MTLATKISAFMGVFGMIFIAIGVMIFIPTYNLMTYGVRTTGEIVDVKTSIDSEGTIMYTPVVRYTCGNQDVTSTSNISSSGGPLIGSKIDIYCRKENPQEFVIDDFIYKYFGLIFVVFGIVDLLVVVGILLYQRYRVGVISQLQSTGERIEGKIISLGYNMSITVNNKHPYIIEVEYRDLMNTLWIFKSDNLWFDPGEYLHIGENIGVFLDRGNYKKYWVDTSILERR